MDKRRQSRPLLGGGLLLALLVAGLLPLGLVPPAAGLWTADHTLFLPFLSRQEPPLPNQWQGQYYGNDSLSGEPLVTTSEIRLDYDWGSNAPRAGVPADHFSIRWAGSWEFEMGRYTFFLQADDGVRLWLDNVPLIDDWSLGPKTLQVTTDVAAAGPHLLKVEYFDNTGLASVRLHWRRTDLYPQWQGKYYNNPWLEGSPAYSQQDNTIQFEWWDGCPINLLNCDSFSIAWQAEPLFEPGSYLVYLYADEGYRLYIDGTEYDEGWYDGQSARDISHPLNVPAIGSHKLVYHFHDRGTLAEARLWIESLEHDKWDAYYYDNPNLSGDYFLNKHEETVFFDWGLGKAKPKMPSGDNFSVRWSRDQLFHSGCYRFGLFADDGVRLYVDGELLVNEWHDGQAEYHSPVTYLNSGLHEIIIEYYEHSGEAEIRFWWE